MSIPQGYCLMESFVNYSSNVLISYYVHILSRFLASPWQCHLDSSLKVLTHLEHILGQGLLLSATSPLAVTTYQILTRVVIPLPGYH